MIQVKVINSTDRDKIGLFTFHKNLIYIGNAPSSDLLIFDSSLLKNHLILEIAEGKNILHPGKDLDYFHVNGKRYSKHKILSQGDKIKIGETIISIELMQESKMTPYKQKLNQITDHLIKSQSPLIEIIQNLQNEAS